MTGQSLAERFPELAAQWHPTKNGDLTPNDVAPFSNKKAWWLCEKGHEWSAIINSRSQGSRCPYCTGKRVISGETDLASLNPSLAAQWHPTLNGDLMPTDVSLYSNKRVYWLCPTNPSHVWRTSINHRSYGTGCPFCNRHDLIIGVNDVATTHPSLLSELDPNQNAGKSLQQHHATSSKHFIWRCEAGHTWSASIYTRVRGSGCPICAGVRVVKGVNDLPTLFPELSKEWHSTRNQTTTPEYIAKDSEDHVWWLCPTCGLEWVASVVNRTKNGAGCPQCTKSKTLVLGFNDLATMRPDLVNEWDYDANTFPPSQISVFSNRKVAWKCKNDHKWMAIVSNRSIFGQGCPFCFGLENRAISIKSE